MVPRAGRDADERDTALDGDRRHERLRSVAARHAEAVRAPGDGIAGELLEIESVVEHHRLDAELVGQFDETELVDLAAAGPRVADQHRMTRDGDTACGSTLVQRVQALHHGRPRRADHHDEQDHDDRHAQQRSVDVCGHGDHGDR